MPMPLPLGEVALQSNDGEGKPAGKVLQAYPLRLAGSANALTERVCCFAEKYAKDLCNLPIHKTGGGYGKIVLRNQNY